MEARRIVMGADTTQKQEARSEMENNTTQGARAERHGAHAFGGLDFSSIRWTAMSTAASNCTMGHHHRPCTRHHRSFPSR
jgi:hypothetical protein